MRSARLALICLWLLGGAASCSKPSEPPNVILVVVDTLRADRVGVYGNTRGLTPFIDELATRGTVFANAYAPSSWTVPSVASLFTSRYPTQHQVTTIDAKLAEAEITLAEKLDAGGYQTGGFTANYRLWETLGYGQGFQRWQVMMSPPSSGPKVRGDGLRRESLPWVWSVWGAGTSRPVLLYLQYMEPHAPYQPPPEYAKRFQLPGTTAAQVTEVNTNLIKSRLRHISAADAELLASLYDGEVAAVDAELRLMFTNLERRGVLKNAVVIITADHGEELREHGPMIGHGWSLFETVVRIPLIVLAPGTGGGPSVPDNVSLIDVAPTILELVGLEPEPRFEGRSLVQLLNREATLRERLEAWFGRGRGGRAHRDIVLELPFPGAKLDPRAHQQAMVRERWKVLVDKKGGTELFDLDKDPGEVAPVASDAQRGQLHDALTQHLLGLTARANPGRETQSLDEATKEKMRALGYHF